MEIIRFSRNVDFALCHCVQECPNDNTMLSHQLNAYHGNITAENTIRDILPLVNTMFMHIFIDSTRDWISAWNH